MTTTPTPVAPETPDGDGSHKLDDKKARRAKRLHNHGHRLLGYSRFMAIIPALGLFVAAVALTVATFINTIEVTIEAIGGHLVMQDMLVEYIEFADFFLLSIVLYIMSIGIYSLFVDDQIELPHWLEIHNLDDLKEKLIGVIVVVMGVFFLGRLIHGASAVDLLCMGAGIGAVILALSYFVRHVMVAHKALSLQANDAQGDEDAQDAQDEGEVPQSRPLW